MAKSKAKTATKAKAGKRVKLPALNCEAIAFTHINMGSEATGEMATKLAAYQEALGDWRTAQRALIAAGEKPTPFPASKYPNPNAGRPTHSQFAKLVAAFNNSEDVTLPPAYNPVQTDLLLATGCRSISVSQKQKTQPKEWDESKMGPWLCLDTDDERSIPSLLGIGTDARRCHSENVLTLIERPEGNDVSDNPNVVTLNGVRYILGDGKVSGSAIYLVNAHRGGSNYGNIESTRKRMSLANAKGLANLVGRIEDKPNLGGGVKVVLDDEGNECVFATGQVVTWGYLNNGKELTPAQVRKAAEEGTKGIKFAILKDPIVGKPVAWSDLWKEISTAEGKAGREALKDRESRHGNEGKSPQQKSMENSRTTLRTNPMTANFVFSFRSVQIGLIPYEVVTGEGKADFGQGCVVGARCSVEYSVGVNDIKRDAREAAEAAAPKKAKATTVDAPADEETVDVTADSDETVEA